MKPLTVLAVVFGLIALSHAQTNCNELIVPRSEWGARPPRSTGPWPTQQAVLYFLHHSEGTHCLTREQCSARLRNIQNYDMDGNNWNDIGSSFFVGGDGFIYEGRGWGEIATLRGAPYYGLTFIGDFNRTLPSPAVLTATKAFMDCGVTLNHTSTSYGFVVHQQFEPVDCPGQSLFNELKTWPRYSP